MNSKGLAPIFIIIGILILGSSSVVLYQTVQGKPPAILQKIIPTSPPTVTSPPSSSNFNLATSPPSFIKETNPSSPTKTPQSSYKVTPPPAAKTSTPAPTANPTPHKVTNINYESYEDVNGNYVRDSGEGAIHSVFSLEAAGANGQWIYLFSDSTDDNGKKSFTVTNPGKYQIVPGGITSYRQPGPKSFDVDGSGGTISYTFGYYPMLSQTGMKVFVFNDKNENGIRDSDEENVHYQAAKITNLQGDSIGVLGTSINLVVAADGAELTNIPYGDYKVELFPETDSWDYYFKITKQSDIAFIITGEGQQNIYLGAHKLY